MKPKDFKAHNFKEIVKSTQTQSHKCPFEFTSMHTRGEMEIRLHYHRPINFFFNVNVGGLYKLSASHLNTLKQALRVDTLDKIGF